MKKVILVISFGTTVDTTRKSAIGGIEEAIAKAYPEYEVRRAFSSSMILRILKKRQIMIDSIEEALERAAVDGVEQIIIQPTHFMNGFEYEKIVEKIEPYQNRFKEMRRGKPLLSTKQDMCDVIRAVTILMNDCVTEDTAICLMGHGTEAESNRVYATVQDIFKEKGYDNYYIGTVEGTPTLSDVIHTMQQKSYKRVVLLPFMVVAGDHACNDMAGEQETSWKSILEKKGYQVECVLKGLGEVKEIQKIYVRHVKEIISEFVI